MGSVCFLVRACIYSMYVTQQEVRKKPDAHFPYEVRQSPKPPDPFLCDTKVPPLTCSPHHIFLSVTFALVLLALHLLITLSPAEDKPEQTLSYLPGLFHLTFQGSSATPTTNAIIPTPREIVMIKDKRTNRQRHGMYPQQGSRFVTFLWKEKHKRRKDKRSGPASKQTLHNVLSSFRAATAAEKRWKLTLMQVQARLTAAMPSCRFADYR
jgi:hypothetical protein